MKPNTRILNYVTLVQDGVLTLDDVPQDIAKEVTKWVRYLSGEIGRASCRERV